MVQNAGYATTEQEEVYLCPHIPFVSERSPQDDGTQIWISKCWPNIKSGRESKNYKASNCTLKT